MTSGDGTITRIDEATARPAANVPAGTMPLDPGFAAGGLWVPDGTTGNLLLLDPDSGRRLGSLHLGTGIFVAQEAAGALWVLNYSGTDVWRVAPPR